MGEIQWDIFFDVHIWGELYSEVLRCYSWFCTQKLLLAYLREQYKMCRLNPGWLCVRYIASIYPIALALIQWDLAVSTFPVDFCLLQLDLLLFLQLTRIALCCSLQKHPWSEHIYRELFSVLHIMEYHVRQSASSVSENQSVEDPSKAL